MRLPPVTSGFTIIELLVTMTIAAILVAIAVPSYNNLIASARATEAANELAAALELARSEAAAGTAISAALCRTTTTPPTACSNAVAGDIVAGDFASGYIVFINRNRGGADATLDTVVAPGSGNLADEIVTIVPPAGGAPRVRIQEVRPAPTPGGVGGPTGVIVFRSATTSGSITNGPVSFRVGFPATAATVLACREVTIAAAGRPTVRRVTASGCWS